MIVLNLVYVYIDGLVQERRNSIANTLELNLSCTNYILSLIYSVFFQNVISVSFISFQDEGIFDICCY